MHIAIIEFIADSYIFAKKFIDKVDSGKAISKETYSDMQKIVKSVGELRFIDGKAYQKVLEMIAEKTR